MDVSYIRHLVAMKSLDNFCSFRRLGLVLYPCLAFTLLAATSRGASYKWSDEAGVLHFSDTPPPQAVPQHSFSLADADQRPLLEGDIVIFEDQVFKVMLDEEKDDELRFKVEYINIQRTFPDIIQGNALLFICAVNRERKSTYLAYTVAKVDGGSKVLTLSNKVSKQSPSRMETEGLIITLYHDDREKKEIKILFKKEIPFQKRWEKTGE